MHISGDEPESADAGTTALRTRCVIWHPAGHLPPDRLLDALRRRGIEPTQTDRGAVALAHLSRLHRDDTIEVAIALLLEPERLDRPFELLQAMELYTPRAVAWLYREADEPQLRAVEDHDHETLRALLPDADTVDRGDPADSDPSGSDARSGLRLVDPSAWSPPPSDAPDDPPEFGGGPPEPEPHPDPPVDPENTGAESPRERTAEPIVHDRSTSDRTGPRALDDGPFYRHNDRFRDRHDPFGRPGS